MLDCTNSTTTTFLQVVISNKNRENLICTCYVVAGEQSDISRCVSITAE